MLYFDVETGPLPVDELREIYTEPTLEEFADKCDKRWKPETVAAKYEEAKSGMWEKFVDKAALDAVTGHTVAIGWISDTMDEPMIIDCDGELEGEGLATFWNCLEIAGPPYVGFNIQGFDLPFLFRRSWMLGVRVPMGLRRGRNWADTVVDLMLLWMFGPGYIKLDVVAKLLGLEGKVQEVDGVEVSGANFHKLWRKRPDVAAEYLRQDVMLCVRIANAMGV